MPCQYCVTKLFKIIALRPLHNVRTADVIKDRGARQRGWVGRDYGHVFVRIHQHLDENPLSAKRPAIALAPAQVSKPPWS